MAERGRNFLVSPGLRAQLVKAVIGSAGLRIVGMGFGFLVGIQLARGLGSAGYGVYGLVMSLVALLSVPAEFGMPLILIREVAATEAVENWGRMRGVLRWANRSAWFLSTVIASGVLAWILFTDESLTEPLSLTLLAGVWMIPLVALSRQYGAALIGLHQAVRGQLSDTVIRPITFSLLLFVAHVYAIDLSSVLAMALGVCSATVALAVVLIMFRRALPSPVKVAKVETDANRWWASALPMALTEGMRQLQANVAILVMGALTTVAAVGVFRAATSISAIMTMPITVIVLIGSSTISKLFAQTDQRRLQKLLSWMTVSMTAGTFLLTVPFAISGELLMGKLMGPEFKASNQPLLILSLGSILYAALGPSTILLSMTGHEKRVTRAFLISVAVLTISAGPLVHFYGAIGAAWASALGMVLGNGLMWIDARRLLSLDPSIFSLLSRRAH